MSRINNSDLTKEIIDGAKINISTDDIPSELGKTVVPVMETNPKLLKNSVCLGSIQTTSTKVAQPVISAQGSTKTIYITGICLDNYQDATSDNVSIYLQGTFNDLLMRILTIYKPTTTATTISKFLAFPVPLKLDKNTPLIYSLAFTAGNSSLSISAFGYTVED